MEKKEMSFAEKFQAAGDELEKEIKDRGAMILMASEGLNVENAPVYLVGDQTTATILLASCAYYDNQFKTILERALMAAKMKEKEDNK